MRTSDPSWKQGLRRFMFTMEVMLCLMYFCMGCWQVKTGWMNPMHVGWIEGGMIYIMGTLLCLWLGWRRRQVESNGLLYILLVPQVSHIVSQGLSWRAEQPGVEWPWASCGLIAFLLTMIFFEERMLRKEALRASLNDG